MIIPLKTAKNQKSHSDGCFVKLLPVVGVCMMIVGGVIIFDGLATNDTTVYQQIASRIAMLGGACLFGFGFMAVCVLLGKD